MHPYFSFSIFFVLMLLSGGLFSQDQQNQTAVSLHEQVQDIIFSDPEQALELSEQELEVTQKGTNAYVDALNDAGVSSYYLDEYNVGQKYLEDALNEAVILDYKQGEAEALFSLGDLNILLGKYGTAIDYLGKSLDLFTRLEDHSGMADCMNGIGTIQMHQGNFEKARDYFEKALKYGDKYNQADSYTYLGDLYVKMEAYKEAIHYANESLKRGRENNDNYVISASMDNLGYAYLMTGREKDALSIFKESLQIKDELEDKQGKALTLINIGKCYKNLGTEDSSKAYITQAYNLSNSIGAKKEIRDAALEYARILASLSKLEAAVEAKKQEQKIALLEKDKEFQKKTQRYYIYIGLVLFLLFVAMVTFMYNRYKMKKRTAEALEFKNRIIEEKNKDIMDSIRYAKRIQDAILPPVSYIQNFLHETFVLFLPKDVVAGDFYWMNKLNNKLMIAACDCTGHGVPGAMVSVMCSNFLNRVVKELHITDPGEILDNVRELVIENFKKSESQMKDGMDISLCVFDTDQNTMQWAGANNSLWIVRNGSEEVEEIKADKQPVGNHFEIKPFTTNDIRIETGDLLYLYSDGYADQFGGDNAKKFKSSNFKKLMIQIKNDPIDVQKEKLLDTFNGWKGEHEQVDDVTVLGIRIS